MPRCPHESGLAPALVRILQRPGRTFEIIDEASSFKPPLNASRVSESLGVPRSNVSRVLNNLAEQGVTPKSMYSLKRLGVALLSVLYVGAHNPEDIGSAGLRLSKSILRAPMGLLVTYFIPRKYRREALTLAISSAPGYREALYVYGEELVRPRPLLAETVRSLGSRVNPYLAISVAERLADDKDYLSRPDVREALSLLGEEPREKPAVKDSLDLLILSLLEKDVLASKKYAEKLIPGRNARKKYMHHLIKHAVPVSSHINFRIFDKDNDMVIVMGQGESCARDAVRLLMPYPYTAGILMGGREDVGLGDWRRYDFMATLSLPPGFVSDVISWLDGLCNWDDFRYEVVNRSVSRYVRIYALPYKMFDKGAREWRLPRPLTAV